MHEITRSRWNKFEKQPPCLSLKFGLFVLQEAEILPWDLGNHNSACCQCHSTREYINSKVQIACRLSLAVLDLEEMQMCTSSYSFISFRTKFTGQYLGRLRVHSLEIDENDGREASHNLSDQSMITQAVQTHCSGQLSSVNCVNSWLLKYKDLYGKCYGSKNIVVF